MPNHLALRPAIYDDYTVVEAADKEMLALTVKDYLEVGWIPVGGATYGSYQVDGDWVDVWVQALARPVGEREGS